MRQHSHKQLREDASFEKAEAEKTKAKTTFEGQQGNIFTQILGSPNAPDIVELRKREQELKVKLSEELAALRQKREHEREEYNKRQEELLSKTDKELRSKEPSVVQGKVRKAVGAAGRRLRQISGKAETGRGAKN